MLKNMYTLFISYGSLNINSFSPIQEAFNLRHVTAIFYVLILLKEKKKEKKGSKYGFVIKKRRQ